MLHNESTEGENDNYVESIFFPFFFGTDKNYVYTTKIESPLLILLELPMYFSKQNQKVPSSSPNRCSAGLRNTTLLRGYSDRIETVKIQ